jgi:NADPH-dependent 7-cyano-7-deazaguanine reductase QueF
MPKIPHAILTQAYKKRCHKTLETNTLPLPKCCPMSGNPQPGSSIEISYNPDGKALEVQSLHDYIQSYIGGRGDIRSMEEMIQQITQDCANALGVMVHAVARLKINPSQEMTLECAALVEK